MVFYSIKLVKGKKKVVTIFVTTYFKFSGIN